MTTAIQQFEELQESIATHFIDLKSSDDEATRQTAIALEIVSKELIARMARTIRLAANQRTSARLEHAKLLDVLERCDPHLAKTIVLMAKMADEIERVG